ncbi:MAG: helix-turn-helix transcriptional regulator [Lactobacillus paragasseri]|nr:helix-turn-helix transcriptional regulator [Lactobacillus paragasseri]
MKGIVIEVIDNLGAAIKKRRRSLRMTQEDLAEFSSLSVNFISKIERTGNQNISIQKLDAIAKALQTSVITLIDESSKTPKSQTFVNKLSNDRVFLDKLTNDMKKLPVAQEEALDKSFITIINTFAKEDK